MPEIQIVELLKKSNIKDVSRTTGIPADRMYKWVSGKGKPKTEDHNKLLKHFGINSDSSLSSDIDPKQEGENTVLSKENNPKAINKLLDNGFPINEQSAFVSIVPAPGEENNLIPLGNNEFGLTVRVVPVKAYAGYVDNWGDPEFYETLAKRTLTVMGNFRGHYLAFVVKGDSMENWTSEEMAKESIPEGSIVTGRDIQRHHWKNKLHLHRFQDYVIVHKDGIITKRITEHNTEEGYIICHSLNPNYEDRKLMLDDCLQILNIVDVSRPR